VHREQHATRSDGQREFEQPAERTLRWQQCSAPWPTFAHFLAVTPPASVGAGGSNGFACGACKSQTAEVNDGGVPVQLPQGLNTAAHTRTHRLEHDTLPSRRIPRLHAAGARGAETYMPGAAGTTACRSAGPSQYGAAAHPACPACSNCTRLAKGAKVAW
jgi:hypothetical protein